MSQPILAYTGWRSRLVLFLQNTVGRAAFDLKTRLRHANDTPATSGGAQLAAYEQKVYSQGGEDGILRELFYRIGPGGRFFVEFGVQDGSECNTRLLVERYGWHGLYLEGDAANCSRLKTRWSGSSGISVAHAFLTAENIAGHFERFDVPTDLDLLSIDVDGNDYWLWKALSSYRPRVVVLEYNAAYPPPTRWIMRYDAGHMWDGGSHFGASLASYVDLGTRLGYALVGTDSRGVNAFFLRRDLLAGSGLAEQTAEEAYHPPRYGFFKWHHYRSGPFVTGD